MSALHPSRRNLFLTTKSSRPKLYREQDGYFLLFFISRIATINNATVRITINSSYVLISIILSIKLGTDESTSPNYPGKYIIFAILSFSFLLAFVLRYSAPKTTPFLLHPRQLHLNHHLIPIQTTPQHMPLATL